MVENTSINVDFWKIGLASIFLIFQGAFIPALILKKNDIVDILWGITFPLSSAIAIYFSLSDGFESLDTRSTIIFALLCIWALRLSWHVGYRNLTHKKEDIRYQNWRKRWGKYQALGTYLQVFVLQAIILSIFICPIFLVLSSPHKDMGFLAYAGVVLWISGFGMEVLADEQLRRFKLKKENKGKLMTQGLWSLSRHPNYFGECVQWWALWLIALELPWGWATIISPLGLTYLLLNVSGVNLLEDLMKDRPGFKEYAEKTSIFFPRPPKI